MITDDEFKKFNQKCISDLSEFLVNLDMIFDEMKKEDDISTGDYNSYISMKRKAIDLMNISYSNVYQKDTLSYKSINDNWLIKSDSERLIELKKILEK